MPPIIPLNAVLLRLLNTAFFNFIFLLTDRMVVITFEQLLKAAIMTLATLAMLITMAGSVSSSTLGESDAQM